MNEYIQAQCKLQLIRLQRPLETMCHYVKYGAKYFTYIALLLAYTMLQGFSHKIMFDYN